MKDPMKSSLLVQSWVFTINNLVQKLSMEEAQNKLGNIKVQLILLKIFKN